MNLSVIRNLILGVVASGSAFASLVPSTNADFTAAPTPVNGGSLGNFSLAGVVPGYTTYGSVGSAKPGPAEFNLPAGITETAYINGGYILQNLTTSFTADTKYSLTMQIGQRFDMPLPASYSVLLLSNGVIIANLKSPVKPTPGSFSPATLTFDTGTNPNVVGQTISIALFSNGGGQINVGKISLDASSNRISSTPGPTPTQTPSPGSPVPEPATIAFMLCGLGGIAVAKRRSR
jgi:hypothetical protein